MSPLFKKERSQDSTSVKQHLSGIALLTQASTFKLTLEERVDMTISCRDTDYIPKVKKAGDYDNVGGQKVQIMHNGLIVKRGGYYGEWMERIIKELKGHHEPQEEKVFYEIIQRIDPNSAMIELGSFWAYYSLWFNKAIKGAINFGCEPDPNNIEIGKINAKLNNANITFINTAAGKDDGEIIDFPMESNPGEIKKVPIMSVDKLVEKYKLRQLGILHMDVQGAELTAIEGAIKTIKQDKLRFLIVSTHHFSISKDPLTHFKCLELIKALGGKIITSHTVLESYSGDGLIAASFDKKDKDFTVDISINSSSHSLYRPYEYDLTTLLENYEALRLE
jgi:FkbM family methyltransferase